MNEPAPHHPSKTPSLRFNWQDWLPYFDDPDVPLDQKRELIETLWSLVLSFVDLGFDLNPTQISCGEELDLKALLEAAVLYSDQSNIKNTADQGGEREAS
ncbi:hypothetical protein SAMN04488527_11716 [Aliiroseovarius crassostreae]|nr:hypothetical protein [Aliiroseovarius crassostreae]SFU79293.1 hypothetical protein SAMN04488527_11716 [Aliiroseovarius crassostreae]